MSWKKFPHLLIVVILITLAESETDLEKISLSSASQNSVADGGDPDKAVDGNTSGDYKDGSCSQTPGGAGESNFWEAYLAEKSKVSKVVIYNTLDETHYKYLSGVKVYIGDVYCGEILKVDKDQPSYTVECNNAVGSLVRIVQDYSYLILCEVEVYGKKAESGDVEYKNLALGFPTAQTSKGWNGESSRATDGNVDGRYSSNSCTHSAHRSYNEWQVNLVEPHFVKAVVIHNRRDCCADRLSGAKVYVGHEFCGVVRQSMDKTVYVVECGKTGDNVKISHKHQFLTLCEVEVLGIPSKEESKFVDLAQGAKVSQDSVSGDGKPELAVDGNTDKDFSSNSCTMSAETNNTWWKATLDEVSPISEVIIYNRQDCCQDRIDGATITVDGKFCGRVNYKEGQHVYSIICMNEYELGLFGKEIKIEGNGKTYLTLCEVKILSDPKISNYKGLVNLAYKKNTRQSSIGWGGHSSRGVDGKLSAHYFYGRTCTHTYGPGWWEVDLGGLYLIQYVRIKNREDCCADRIQGVRVLVDGTLCGSMKFMHMKAMYSLKCGLVGKTVQVVNDRIHLTLCEVQVFGEDKIIDPKNNYTEAYGEKSEKKGGAMSVAKCPAGYAATHCQTLLGTVPYMSNGAYVSEDLSSCVAVNGIYGPGSFAYAMCHVNEHYDNPCGGEKVPKFKRVQDQGPDPAVVCPAGYRMVLCNGMSPWRGMLKGFNSVGIIPEGPCKVSEPCDKWCQVTAVCQADMMNEMNEYKKYKKTTCSTCENYKCGEGFECQMVDSEDDTKEPSCVRVSKGCDNNSRCGENECVPIGADDFTCRCGEGTVFDEVVKACLPQHSNWKKVYGGKAMGEDATSSAECGEKMIVMRCYSFGVPYTTDGVTIINVEGTSACVARATNRKMYGVQAVAYCGPRTTTVNFCTNEEEPYSTYRYSTDVSPSVSCPKGYVMESCIFYSPHTEFLNDDSKSMIDNLGNVAIDDDGTCKINDCVSSTDHWCTLSALCTKLNEEQFIEEVCPTCDLVTCPEGMTCFLEDSRPECREVRRGPCDGNPCGTATCVPDSESYSCSCKPGYVYQDNSCVDIDECSKPICSNGKCINMEGSYRCECLTGYKLESGRCNDIDECKDNPCKANEACSNLPGTFSCDCKSPFVSTDDGCTCADGYKAKGGKCVDIDECDDSDTCADKPNQKCSNTKGGYKCKCKKNYTLDSGNVCRKADIGECGIKSKKVVYKAFIGTNIQVKLKGSLRNEWKKAATITWRKNGEIWKPIDEDKDKFKGFKIIDFKAEDTGIYVAQISLDDGDTLHTCSATIELLVKEASVEVKIDNKRALRKPLRVGRPAVIKCKVATKNLKISDPEDKNNVRWYRVIPGGEDQQLTEALDVNPKNGVYEYKFENPTSADSGTYRCEFQQETVVEKHRDRIPADAIIDVEVALEFK